MVSKVWAVVVLAIVMLTIAACTREDDGLDPLEGGIARGPGFSFQLGSEWRAIREPEESIVANRKDRERLLREARGLVQAGAWKGPGGEIAEDVTVFVVIGQTVQERPWEATRAAAQEAGVRDFRIDQRGVSLDGADAAFTSSRNGPDGEIHTRSIMARRGTLSYTINIQADAPDLQLELLRGQVATTWRWRPLSGAGRERIRKSRELEGSGYRVTVPEGWRGAPGDVLPEAEELEADTFWTGYQEGDTFTNVVVLFKQAPYDDLGRSLPLLRKDSRRAFEPVDSFRRGPDLLVGGEPAASFDVTTRLDGERWRHLDVFTVHDGQVYSITLGSLRHRHAQDRRAFLDALGTWRWK